MRWEELTGDQFPQAAAEVQGVCLLPLSCIERHAHHLPLGTDMYIARELCRRAVEIEPAIIYPDFFYTQILEARHSPAQVIFKQGETDMSDKGSKDKSKKEQQKKARLNPKEKRKLKKEKENKSIPSAVW